MVIPGRDIRSEGALFLASINAFRYVWPTSSKAHQWSSADKFRPDSAHSNRGVETLLNIIELHA